MVTSTRTVLLVCWVALELTSSVFGASRVQGQEGTTTIKEAELCKDKDPGEWFRLAAGDGDACRDVIQCTSSGLQTIRCPAGMVFDIEKQTCDWKDSVRNCKLKNKESKVKPNGLNGSNDNNCDNDPNCALPCDPAVCVLPECVCSEHGTEIPVGYHSRDVPQMITITFDGAINNDNIDLYNKIFDHKRKKNPNSCDIKATFFVSHKYTNYSAVQELHRKGHEIAVNSITHNDEERFWSNATVDDWSKEMAGMRIIAEKYANLTDNIVVGVRAPYLRVGGNNQFTMMEEQAFLYDSSITAPLSKTPLWPYTMHFRMPHRCHGNQSCPTRSYAVWELVMNEVDCREKENDKYLPGCAMVDSCSNIVTRDQFYNFLNHNFDRHYEQNRAPIGLHLNAAWLNNNPQFLDALLYWIDEILATMNDVYFVTMTQVIQWIQNPLMLREIRKFEPWREKCSVEGNPACWVPHSCKLTSKEVPGETINLQTCVRCPNNYPWVNDPTGDDFF